MKTAKILSFTTLVAMVMGACAVSLAEEVKDSSSSTEIVSAKGSDLRNEDALRVAVGDFDDVEFLLSAEEMAIIADNANVSFNDISAQGYERSVASMFPGEASEQVETTQSASTTFNGALTLASATNTSETVTTSVGAVAMSLSSDKSTEQYATGVGKSYYEQVSTSNSGSAVTTYSATSLLGNSNSVGDTDGSYGISTLDSGIVPYSTRTWTGDDEENKWGGRGNWSGSTWSSGDDATFGSAGSANSTVTVDGNFTVAKITVSGGTDYTFIYEEGASLTVTGTVTIGSSSGTHSLTITGGTNVFSGEVDLGNSSGNTGTLEINDGTNNFTGIIYVARKSSSTGTLTITGGENTFSSSYMYVGYGVSSTGSLTITGGENTFNTEVRLGGSSESGTKGTAEVTISGGNNTFNGQVDVGNTGNCTMTISGDDTVVTFKGAVRVAESESSGNTGSLTITGGTTIFDGTVDIGYSGTGTMTITGGNTTIKGATTISKTGSLTIGDNGATGRATVYLETQIGTTTTGDVTITGNAEIIISGALLDSIVELAESENGGAVAVICASTITFGDISLSEYQGDLGSLINPYISAEGYDLTWSYSGNTLWVIAAVAPEPSMFGLFFGLGAIGLVATRRRRRKA